MVKEFLRNISVLGEVALWAVYLGLSVNAEKSEYMLVSHFQNARCRSAFKKVCIRAAVCTELFRLFSTDNFVKVSF